MKHLITGGAGFIGSHLIKELLYRQEKVICLDNFCTGNIRNLENFKNNSNFELINQSVEKPLKIHVNKMAIQRVARSVRKYIQKWRYVN